MKKCQFCAEEIQDDAMKCKHCGEFLSKKTTYERTTDQKNNTAVLNVATATIRAKSLGVSFLLTLFFGPIGLFYSTIIGGLLMLIVLPVLFFIGMFTSLSGFGFGLTFFILYWPICIVWGLFAANSHNNGLLKAVARGVAYKKTSSLLAVWVTLAIGCLIAAIVIPQYDSYKKRGYCASARADLKNAYVSAQVLLVDNPDKIIYKYDELPGFQKSDACLIQIEGFSRTGGFIAITHPECDKVYFLDKNGIITEKSKKTDGVEKTTELSKEKSLTSAPSPSPTSSQSSNEEIMIQTQKIMDDYFIAVDSRNLEDLLSFYANEVDYFNAGIVTRDFIKKDKTAYFKRWTTLETKTVGEPQIDAQDSNIISVKFSTNWMVQNDKKTIHGTADNTWKFRKTEDGMKIIYEKQEVTSRNR